MSQVYTGTVTSHQKLPVLLAHFSLVDPICEILDSLPFIGFQVTEVCGYFSITLLSWLITCINLWLAHLNGDFLHTNKGVFNYETEVGFVKK